MACSRNDSESCPSNKSDACRNCTAHGAVRYTWPLDALPRPFRPGADLLPLSASYQLHTARSKIILPRDLGSFDSTTALLVAGAGPLPLRVGFGQTGVGMAEQGRTDRAAW